MATEWQADRDQVLAYRVGAHHLAERLPAEALRDAAGACGVQDTPPGNAQLALAARVEPLGSKDVGRALTEERSVVASWSLRGAVHVFPTSDLGVFTLGALPDGEASLRAALGGFALTLEETGVQAIDALQTVLDEALAVLDDRELTKAELSGALHDRVPDELRPWCERCGVDHVSDPLLRMTGLSGRICFGAGSGNRLTLVRTERWLGAEPEIDRAEARSELLRRFLRCFGPATPELFAAWTGMDQADARRSWRRWEAKLVAVDVDGTSAWLHEAELDAFRSPPQTQGVRLLAANDPFLHQRDREVLAPDPALRRRMWRAVGNPGLVLLEGRPVALWRPRKQGKRLHVVLEPFERLSASARSGIEAEAARLAPLRGCADATVEVTR